MSQIARVLQDASVFSGTPLEERPVLLQDLKAYECFYKKGEAFRRMGEEMDFYPIVMQGKIQATMPHGGQDHIVATFGPGDSFAEAVPVAMKRCPVDIWVLQDACVLCIPVEELDACENTWVAMLRANIATELSKKVNVLSETLAMLSEPRLPDRILTFLGTQATNKDGTITVPYSRLEWAGILRVAEKSLIRELSNMHKAGILDVRGRTIRILKDSKSY